MLVECPRLQYPPDEPFSLQSALTLWLKNFAHDSPLSREQLATVVEELLPTRHKRADGRGAFSDA